MTAPLARLLEDQPVAAQHPSWCVRHSGDVHVSAESAAEGQSVHLLRYGSQPPVVQVGCLDPVTPAGARRLAKLLAGLSHPELAALITRMAAMAEGAS